MSNNKIRYIVYIIVIVYVMFLTVSCNRGITSVPTLTSPPTISVSPATSLTLTPEPSDSGMPSSAPSVEPSPSPEPNKVPTKAPTSVPSPSQSPSASITPAPLIDLKHRTVVSPADMVPEIAEGLVIADASRKTELAALLRPDLSKTVTDSSTMLLLTSNTAEYLFWSYTEEGKTHAVIRETDDLTEGNLSSVTRQLAIVSPRNILSAAQVDDTSKLKEFDAGKYSVAGKSPYRLREITIPFLLAMFADAEKDGIKEIQIRDTYRNYRKQTEMFNKAIARRQSWGLSYTEAFRQTDRATAYPGTSEHHDGYTTDLTNAGLPLDQNFGKTAFGKWLAANSYKHGFAIRYPEGKETQTTKMYEPWHVRFVGIQAAAVLKKHGIVLEEFHSYLSKYKFLTSEYNDGKVCIFMNASSVDNISTGAGISDSGKLMVSERGDGEYIVLFVID